MKACSNHKPGLRREYGKIELAMQNVLRVLLTTQGLFLPFDIKYWTSGTIPNDI